MRDFDERTKTAEASRNLRSLSFRVIEWCEAHPGVALSAGPVPRAPTEDPAVVTSDAGFEELGWTFGQVRYRYTVQITENAGATILAEGDLDGDGILSEFRIDCSSDCECGALVSTNELE